MGSLTPRTFLSQFRKRRKISLDGQIPGITYSAVCQGASTDNRRWAGFLAFRYGCGLRIMWLPAGRWLWGERRPVEGPVRRPAQGLG